jgi:hypothetical protein
VGILSPFFKIFINIYIKFLIYILLLKYKNKNKQKIKFKISNNNFLFKTEKLHRLKKKNDTRKTSTDRKHF